jgi:hypothetical protein
VAETVFGPVVVFGEAVEGAAEFRSELARTADETERQAKKVQQIEGVCVAGSLSASLGRELGPQTSVFLAAGVTLYGIYVVTAATLGVRPGGGSTTVKSAADADVGGGASAGKPSGGKGKPSAGTGGAKGGGQPRTLEQPVYSEGATTELSQPGGLKATEGRTITKKSGQQSKPTHPLAEHGPDVPDQALKGRAQNELVNKNRLGSRTKFNDRAQMESAIAEVKRMRKADIDAWLDTNPPAGVTQRFTADPGMGNLGSGYEATTPGGPYTPISRPLENVNVILISDGHGGFLIHSAYPS